MEVRENNNKLDIAIALGLIGLAVLLRLLPHAANFAPIASVAIFAGAVLPRRYAILTPVTAMVLSDLVIGLHDLILVTWGCYALIALASSVWLQKRTFMRGAALTLGSSVFFFLITNFAVWAQGTMYPLTLAGLSQCFTLALPFFRATFTSDIFYTATLFGTYTLATNLGKRLYESSHTSRVKS